MKKKICSKCLIEKDINDFHLDSRSEDLHRRWCKVCARTSALNHRNKDPEKARANYRTWAKNNPDKECDNEKERRLKNLPKARKECRNRHLKKVHGITSEQWEILFNAQGRKCAICSSTEPGRPPHNVWATDHDHETGNFRGILCPKCNKGLGLMNDNPIQLLAAIVYLLKEKREN